MTYHIGDSMTSQAVDRRSAFYETSATPTYFVDGKREGQGGGLRSAAVEIYEQRIVPIIDRALPEAPVASLALAATIKGAIVSVNGTVVTESQAAHAVLQILLVEEEVRYSGSNGIRFHPMVARAVAPSTGRGLALETGIPTAVNETFDLVRLGDELRAHVAGTAFGPHLLASEWRDHIDSARVAIIAFVQEERRRRVLQSVVMKPATR